MVHISKWIYSIALYITNIKSKFKWLNNKTEINKPIPKKTEHVID